MIPLLILLYGWVPSDNSQSRVSVANAEHYRWGDCCDGWYLVQNERLNVIQERMPSGSSETRHVHHKAQQFFFVLSGEASIELGTATVVLHRGEGLRVPPGVVHRVMNRAKAVLELMVTSEPPSHGDREDVP